VPTEASPPVACGHSPAAGTGWASRPAAVHIPHTWHHQRQHRL